MVNDNIRIAIYPGTFDPITYGHVDVLERASELFDKVIVVIAVNSSKTTLFSEEERLTMARESLKDIRNIEVIAYQGLTVDCATELGACAIVRGIRAISDYEYELQIALMNRKLAPNVHTLFMLPNEKYTYLNSSIIREIGRYNQDVSEFVPEFVAKKLKEKYFEKHK
jgi:pantetheine-phosphate adenylyltransferase